MLYMNNFYSIEETDMFSFPPFEDVEMANVDRVDSVISNGSDSSVGMLKKEMFDGNPAKESISRPPTPPDSGSSSPLGPERLRSYIPPPNYGTVEDDRIFRSSFPQDRNLGFVKTLKIRSVLSLVDTDPSPGYQQWMLKNDIQQKKVDIATNKDGKVNTTIASICEAILFAEDSNNWPLYVHCNQGKHRTGCLVACFRKVQSVPMEEIIDEYRAYAGAKARDGDIEFIKSFNPKDHETYRRCMGLKGPRPVGDVNALFQEGDRHDEVLFD